MNEEMRSVYVCVQQNTTFQTGTRLVNNSCCSEASLDQSKRTNESTHEDLLLWTDLEMLACFHPLISLFPTDNWDRTGSGWGFCLVWAAWLQDLMPVKTQTLMLRPPCSFGHARGVWTLQFGFSFQRETPGIFVQSPAGASELEMEA